MELFSVIACNFVKMGKHSQHRKRI